ncbi:MULTISPECIES: hypothetical protein [unclassified Archaeoglobus]|mgnify:CR=1 FL=1|jgi:hypothetical protein|uniref:hypothetical protein n=1 Tax=unclassified Archaeoglobus TaxID=2643606 RepID=UPI0025C73276|nr:MULTISPECIES: hypothetical protein [unclassified Archaeoglobus]
MKGACNNPKSYYFDTEVDEEFEPEECGLRKCKYCPHFIRADELDDLAYRELERERDRLGRMFGLF